MNACLREPLSSNPLEYAYEVLERLGQSLQVSSRSQEQVHLTLEAVRESLDADVVFWYADRTGEPFEQIGCPRLSEEWARVFLSRAPRGDRAVCHFLDPALKPITPWPASAALVRIGSGQPAWLGALSFHPRQLFRKIDLNVLLLARRLLVSHRQHNHTYERLRDSLLGMVRCLTSAIDHRLPHWAGHSECVARVAVRLGQEMGLAASTLSDLYLAGLLHNLGMLGVRDELLLKQVQLTAAEYAELQHHVLIGDQLVSQLQPLAQVRPGVRWHHERWDGLGYPDGLVGEQIPLQARLLAVADAYAAMIRPRPFRNAFEPEEVVRRLSEGAGTQWDPDIIAILMTCRHDLHALCQQQFAEGYSPAVPGNLRPLTEKEGLVPAGKIIVSRGV
ncbi:MAG: HD domain-containing phosphohydrolase [Gemmataceae bacterium]